MTVSRQLAEVFAAEWPCLTRFLRRFEPTVSAEEVAQDAFARLAAAEPGSVQAPRAWLFQTARNLALNELRRSKMASSGPAARVADLELTVDAPSAEDFIISMEEAERLRAVLMVLPQRQRRSLLLFKIEGLSHKEIGLRLGVSHRTVERYVASAIAKCHAHLSALRAEDQSQCGTDVHG